MAAGTSIPHRHRSRSCRTSGTGGRWMSSTAWWDDRQESCESASHIFPLGTVSTRAEASIRRKDDFLLVSSQKTTSFSFPLGTIPLLRFIALTLSFPTFLDSLKALSSKDTMFTNLFCFPSHEEDIKPSVFLEVSSTEDQAMGSPVSPACMGSHDCDCDFPPFSRHTRLRDV